jgi:hypothetical protein
LIAPIHYSKLTLGIVNFFWQGCFQGYFNIAGKLRFN